MGQQVDAGARGAPQEIIEATCASSNRRRARDPPTVAGGGVPTTSTTYHFASLDELLIET